VAAIYGGGRWVRAARDEAGRVVALENSEGRRRLFAYDSRGALTDYVDARGARRSFEYDTRGRLQSITGADGASLRLIYDREGRFVSVRHESGGGVSGGARFVRAGYGPPVPAPLAALQTGFGCLGAVGGDGWFEGDTWDQTYGTGCWELLGGFGGDGSDWWLYNPSPEGCMFCAARHKLICQNEWDAKYARAIGIDIAATAACTAVTAGTLALVCAAAAGLHAYSQVVAATAEYNSCILRIPESCAAYCR